MSPHAIDLWTIAIGILTNTSCALVGCWLVLRRMSLLGDAISHAVLPGIVIVVAIFGSRAPLPLFLGAMALGVLTAFLTQTVHQFANVTQDTGMGVVFTTLFALGVLLIRVVPGLDKVDLDPACVFEGNIEYEVLYLTEIAGVEVPRAVIVLGATLLVVIAFLAVLWKELKIVTFDPDLATSLGLSSTLIYYLLMAMVAGTTVASFWAVGSILVIAMLIVPGATAHLLTDRLPALLGIAAAVAAISSAGGYLLADRWNTSAAGMMAVVAGAQYFVALLFAPAHGAGARWLRHLGLSLRIAREDILAAIYRKDEVAAGAVVAAADLVAHAGGGVAARVGLGSLARRGLVVRDGEGVRLSDVGRELARRLVRSHRLWESYLAQHADLPVDHLHEPAMRMEHFVTPEIERHLLDEIDEPERDPHGKPIPPAE